ncbi:hypothetical protein Tco_0212240 [Tanacetum coccineum]
MASMAMMRACCPIHLHPSILIQRHHHGTPPTPTEIPLPTPSPPLLLPSTDHKERKHAESYTDTRDDMIEDIARGHRAATDVQYWSLMSGRLNMLVRDRRAHGHTALCMEREARLSHKAWGRSMDASDTARSEVRALRTTVLAHRQRLQLTKVESTGRDSREPAMRPARARDTEEADSSS